MAKRFKSLPGLPGGVEVFLVSLIEILKQVDAYPLMSRDEFESWLKVRFGRTTDRSVLNVVDAVHRLELIEFSSDKRVKLTSLGKRMLAIGFPAGSQELARHLCVSYVGLVKVLEVFVKASGPLHADDVRVACKSSVAKWQVTEMIRWLWVLGCIQTDGASGKYLVTKAGMALWRTLQKQTRTSDLTRDETDNRASGVDERRVCVCLADLIAELKAAAVDSANYKRLEKAVADAFRFLGFKVQLITGSGNTDVIVYARSGPRSFKSIVDAKSTKAGKRAEVNCQTLAKHRKKYNADYAIAVASVFTGGQTNDDAHVTNVVLLIVTCLIEWLTLHDKLHLNPVDYQPIFQAAGLLKELPPAVIQQAEAKSRLKALMKDTLKVFEDADTQKLRVSLSSDKLLATLAERAPDTQYRHHELQTVIALLSNPVIRCLGQEEDGFILLMESAQLKKVFAALAKDLARPDVLSPWGAMPKFLQP